jgi:UDP-N-acetylmuramyl pentapeptide phosphotransferase/UDP-N-acetylglucosamine-1-phosphate transferase
MMTMALFGAAFVASAALTGIVTDMLRKRAILDLPNARSSHSAPTPRGGGWGMMLALMPFWMWAEAGAGVIDHPDQLLPGFGASLLMIVSWADDRRGLTPITRFAAQSAAVGAVVMVLPGGHSLTGGMLPIVPDRVLTAVIWLWFVNLFNFMDGIDGISGGSAAAMGGGLFLVWPDKSSEAVQGGLIAAAAIGFLVWNWAPAKVFMGDVGSIPIGYLLGYGLIRLAMAGEAVAALIIALYYLADATITLLRRLSRGERVWRAHREHFYQQSVRRGRSHATTATAAIIVQLVLVAFAVMSIGNGVWMLIPAVVMVALLLLWMARPRWAAP